MASGAYAYGIKYLTEGSIDYDTDTIKAQLTQSSYAFDSTKQETHNFRDDVTGSLVTGTTDQTVSAKAITINTTDNKVYLDCTASLTWSSVNPDPAETVGGVVIYKARGGAASADELLCWCEFASTIETNGSDIQVNFNSNGVASFAYA